MDFPATSDQRETVSVLIPAFNAHPFLQRAVDSALAQTHPPIEVIIVNDCSTDSTLTLCRELSLKDDRIKVFTLETNQGPSAARNFGLSEARGDLVAVLDADDAISPNRLADICAVARDFDIVADDFVYFDPHTNVQGQPTNNFGENIVELNISDFLKGARPYLETPDLGLLKPVFRRSFLSENKLSYIPNVRHGEDFRLVVDMLLKNARYAVIRQAGYIYTHRSSGWSRTQVNYSKVISSSKELLSEEKVRADKSLVSLIETRIFALARWSDEYRMRKLWSERKILNLALAACKNWHSMFVFSKLLSSRVSHS